MIKTKDRQTLFDVALVACGDIETIFEIARVNDISITEDLPENIELKINNIGNRRIVDYFASNRFCPASVSESCQEYMLTSNDGNYILASNDGDFILTQN